MSANGKGDPILPQHKKPDWFGDGTDLPKLAALGEGSVSFPDWATHNEWAQEDIQEDTLPPDVRPPYSTEDRKHEWQRESVKLPPIKQKQQRHKISKAEQPFWHPKPEKSFKSSNTKPIYKPKEPEDEVQMFNLISMQYQKDWIGLTKNRDFELVRKNKQLKEQQKAKLLEHTVKRNNINARSDNSGKEQFKLSRFSNIPSRYLNATT
ncbi:hypothetical protein LOD99_14347 [Oopsacas minuta]|uniref:Uncharacterized protein n=1 Tax=Oopsacas minuta TaxID=111878 RepID=A0AAV7KF13_9METZ|nr:hypothetical protein LOD99_14347 [Oopsacas minuta]